MKNNIYLRLKNVLLPLFFWLLIAMSLPGIAQTITTDKTDYLPGENVQISGTGWQAGEMVSLTIEHLVFTDHPTEYINTTADESGKIINTDYTIDAWDLGETFRLTATGQSSTLIVSVVFTDAEGSYSKPYAHWSDEPLPGDWNNNILNDNKSNYFEGEVIPHVFMYGASNNAQLVNGESYSFNVTYNWYQANTDAGGFAYMTQYDLSRQPNVFNWATPAITPVIDNSFTNSGGMHAGSFYTVDADITTVSAVTYTGSGTKDGHVTITFTYTGTTTSSGYAAIYYGLYIAKPGEVPNQGAGKTNGANAWSGGSLQTTVDIGGSGGTSLQLAPSAIIPGEISGLKFSDLNNNSTQDTGEPGLAGWTICLDSDSDPNNGNLGCVQTSNGTTDDQDGDGAIDPLGFFYFSVTPGTYYVFEVTQEGWTMTMPSKGYYGPLVVSATTTSFINQNFGNYYCVPPVLDDATLALCATPGDTTAIFDLTTAETGVDTDTMTIVYSDANGTIDTPSAYKASDGATVTVTAYYNDSNASCNDEATITLTVYPEPTAVASNSGPVCYGTLQITLDETGGDAVAWEWSSDGSAVIKDTNDKNPTVTGFADGEIFTVEITDANGCTSTATTTVSVNTEIKVSVDDEAVCYGEDVTFTATASGGTGNYTYVWSVNGTAQAPTSSNTLDLMDVTADATISVTVTDDFISTVGVEACSASDSAALDVNDQITVSVDDEAVCYGEDVTFTATAGGGTGNYTYVWSVNGTAQDPTSSNTLDLMDVTADATISVTVTDDFAPTSGATACTATDDATLNVNSEIKVTVDDEAVCYGEDVTFTATAGGGTGNYTYVWSVNGTAQAPTSNNTLDLMDATADATISVTVTDDFAPTSGVTACTATDDATLDVNDQITVSVDDEAVCYGEDVTFTADASGGTGKFTYVWSVDGVPQDPTSSNTLDLMDVTADATISVTVTDDFMPTTGATACTASGDATLNVNSEIKVTVDDEAVCYGVDVTFTADVSGGTGNYTYVWSVNGAAQEPTSNNTLDLLDVTADATISVTVADDFMPTTGATACTATDDAILNVNDQITVSVEDEAVCYGEDVTFTATASGGTGKFTYVWSVNGAAQEPTSSNTLDLENVTADATISVTVNDDFFTNNNLLKSAIISCNASDNAALTVNDQITVSVEDQAVCYGEDVTFTANASGGTGNYTYVWSVNGTAQAPTSSSTLDLENVTADATISVTVKDDFAPTSGVTACTATDDATLDVNDQITVSVEDEAVCYGEDVTFTATASGGTGKFTYVWSVDGTAQSPTSSNTLDLENVTADATISVTVNDDFIPTFGATACTATDNATLDVNDQITVSITADPNCELGKAGLPSGIVTVTGSGYETLQLWSAGADGAIGGGDDELIESATTSTSPYDFEDVYSGSYYVIAQASHPSGTGTCDETSNVAVVDECYWFNIAKVTQGSVDPTKDWKFSIYEGPDGFGNTSVGSGSTLNDADGILTFGNVNLDPTKTYTICEEQMAAGWSAIWVTDINGTQTVLMTYNPNADDNPPADLGNRCFDIGAGTSYPLYPNDIFTIHVDNTYPGGTARTPGYWKNWNRCTTGGQAANADRNGGWQEGYWLLDDVLNSPGVTLGGFKVTTCQIGVYILDQRDIKTLKKNASDAAYTLAMHLMAFKLNQAAGAYGCPYATDAAQKADALLLKLGYKATGTYLNSKAKDYAYALSLAKILDEYNNNRLTATDCAKTVKSAELAEIGVPATTFESTFRAYPNPFTDKLNIEFSSATDTQVRLEIYSITGARLEVLFNGPVNGGELYTVEYLPKLVSSQIVFYHLTINGTTQVGKLIFNERR